MDNLRFRYKKVENLEKSEIESWEKLWQEKEDSHFFNSPDYIFAYIKTFPNEKIEIVFCYIENEIAAVLPLCKSRKYGIPVWSSPDRVFGLRQSLLDRSTLLLGKKDKELASEIISELEKARNMFLKHIVSKDLDLMGEKKGIVEKSGICPRRKLDGDVLENMPGNQKRAMRSRMRKNKVHLNFRFERKEMKKQINKMIDIENRSEKKLQGRQIFDKEDAIKMYNGWVKQNPDCAGVGILYFDHKPIAHLFGLLCKKTFLAIHMAFDSQHRNLGPGKMVTFKTMQWLKDNGYEIFDFSRGESRLKSEFCDRKLNQYNMYCTRNTLIRLWWKLLILARRILKWLRSMA